MIHIVCACQRLIEVVDRKVVDHVDKDGKPCPTSGMHYVSKRVRSNPGGPKVDVVAISDYKDMDGSIVVAALIKVTPPDASQN